MKREKKYLPLYYEWMEAGEMPCGGLCFAFSNSRSLKLFAPTRHEAINHKASYAYWGSGDYFWRLHEFTPLRQNILLFMAAINNEL